MPTLVPADLPSPPSRPSGSRGHIHSGPVSWAGCPATAGTPTPLGAALVAGWRCQAEAGVGGNQGPLLGPPGPEQDRRACQGPNVPAGRIVCGQKGSGLDTRLGTGLGSAGHEYWDGKIRDETRVHPNA